jgi:hypothetical protein
VWQQQWAPSLDASWDAFSRLLGVSLPLGHDSTPAVPKPAENNQERS